MKSTICLTGAALALALTAAPAAAGIYGDDLSRCLVSSSTDEDKSLLVRWVFGIISLNPDVKDLAKVSDAELAKSGEGMLAVFEKLLMVTCREKALLAIKYEGAEVLQSSFGTFGQVAMRSLMSDPAVARGMEKSFGDADEEKWEAFMREAGVSTRR